MAQQRTTPASTEAPRVGELERLGPDGREALVIGVEAPGFDDLSPREKRFAYYMYRAAIPGNVIAYRQAHRDADTIVRVLETCFLYSEGLDPVVREALHEYLKLIWVHHGQYHHHTHAKFTPPTLTLRMFGEAAVHALQRGATFPRAHGNIAAQLSMLIPSRSNGSGSAWWRITGPSGVGRFRVMA